jgi:hypothetical protein
LLPPKNTGLDHHNLSCHSITSTISTMNELKEECQFQRIYQDSAISDPWRRHICGSENTLRCGPLRNSENHPHQHTMNLTEEEMNSRLNTHAVDIFKQVITPHKAKCGKQMYPLPLPGTNGFNMSYYISWMEAGRFGARRATSA